MELLSGKIKIKILQAVMYDFIFEIHTLFKGFNKQKTPIHE